MYLLDTNVVSELRKAQTGRADPAVVGWAAALEPATLFISVVTVQELELGVCLAERRNPSQGILLRAWLERQVMTSFRDRTLPIDAAIAIRCARLHVPDRRPERDALIAATALVHGMTVATRNIADFAPTGAAMVNPWSG